MSGHTPGPWLYGDPDGGIVAGPSQRHPGGLSSVAESHGNTAGERQANARLIAAAPEMLAALVQWDHALALGNVKFRTPAIEIEARKATSAAIAKAKGE